METFIKKLHINAPAEKVFCWHARPGAFERLSPPWERVRVIERTGGIENGARVLLEIRTGPIRQRWHVEHRGYQNGKQFCDFQVRGPFAHWEHFHRVEPVGAQSCWLADEIQYRLPLGAIGRWLGGRFVRRKLAGLFAYRHEITAADVAAHHKTSGGTTMNIAMSGSHGLIGEQLIPFLTTGGHRVLRLVRKYPNGSRDSIPWDPEQGILELDRLEGCHAVVHLAGESIASGRWTEQRKAAIRDSRVQGTRALCESLAKLSQPPRVLVCASAIGFYGDRADEQLTEASPRGQGFLADVCDEWEQATQPAREKGIRVVNLRFGMVLSPAGGALAKMLTPFRLGAGGPMGNGQQFVSWIAIDDAIRAIHFAIVTETLQGPVNLVAPEAVTNREFAHTLGLVLRRPTLLAMPAFAARAVFGEMADELLLASTRVAPAKLNDSKFEFRHPRLEHALRHLLGKNAKTKTTIQTDSLR